MLRLVAELDRVIEAVGRRCRTKADPMYGPPSVICMVLRCHLYGGPPCVFYTVLIPLLVICMASAQDRGRGC